MCSNYVTSRVKIKNEVIRENENENEKYNSEYKIRKSFLVSHKSEIAERG